MQEDRDKRTKIILILITATVILLFFYRVRTILLPFLLGILIAYLVNPFIVFMKGRGFTRRGALIFLLIIIVNVFFIIGLILFPLLVKELEHLTEMVPDYIALIEDIINDLNRHYRQINLPPIVEDSLNRFLQQLEEFLISIIQRITEGILDSIYFIVTLFLAPIISYYLLRDIEGLKQDFLQLIPVSTKKILYRFGREINKIFVGFLRAQVWISFFVGILVGISLYFINIRFYLLLGIFAGITNMIPYFGPFIGCVPAAVIALMVSPMKMLVVILLYTAIQQVESALIAPRIMSENVGLHPVTVIFSLLAGAELLGVWGLVFAVPVAGGIKVVFKLAAEKMITLNSEV